MARLINARPVAYSTQEYSLFPLFFPHPFWQKGDDEGMRPIPQSVHEGL
jgi:hypothetical protein